MRTTGNTPVDGEVRAVASGALANGNTVIVNADGTVSVVGIGAESLGSIVTFEAASTDNYGATYDPDTGKVILTYRDNGNSFYGTAIVGTVSGTSISFGSAVVFESAHINFTAPVYDTNLDKVVIAYNDEGNSRYGTAIVGTVSGTTISFGTAVVFESARSDYISAAYDENAQKVLVSYRDVGDSNNNKSIVGTVSGTGISFGSPVTFRTGSAYYLSSAYDANANKIVISYSNSSFLGRAVVATISGTNVSFGSEATFSSASTPAQRIVYDSANNTVVIAYMDGGDGDKGKAVIGTVSGTSVSFNSPTVFYDTAGMTAIAASYDSNAGAIVISFRGASAYGLVLVGTTTASSITFGSPLTITTNAYGIGSHESVYDSTSKKVVLMYKDQDDGNKGKSVVYSSAPTNLTSENYIGIAKGAAADGTSAVVQTGCSINDAQSGLTAGQDYYVQTDGTLGETPDNPSVLAGTAVSATKLIVKG